MLYIKWAGYPEADCTWEKLNDNYESIPEIIDDYFSNKSLKVVKKKGRGIGYKLESIKG